MKIHEYFFTNFEPQSNDTIVLSLCTLLYNIERASLAQLFKIKLD